MTLAALDLLATVVAHRPTDLAALDGLGVDTGGTGRFLATGFLADASPQCVQDRLPGAVTLPAFEVIVGRASRAEVVRQVVPLAARAALVEQGVDDLAEIDLPRSPAGLGGRQDGLNQVPLGVRQVRGIGFAHGWGPDTGCFVTTPSLSLMLRSPRLSE